VPVHGDDRLYERLTLEAFQSGLSWLTILRKRENFRAAFANFSIPAVAAFTEVDAERLLADPGIVRNRAKVTATVGNARAWLELDDPAALLWSFVRDQPIQNHWTEVGQIPASTADSEAMSKELRRRGFRFVGPTICYALMQSCGLVNDHVTSCFRYAEVARLA
jgi:DNA-3-methyladenine glycosylase I